MDAKFKATKIKWDVDKEDIKESFSLPKEIDVPEEIVEETMEKMALEMSDYVSDKTGFCHKGLFLECYSMTKEKFDEARMCLINNGVDEDEADLVLQALCYILLDEETEEFFE